MISRAFVAAACTLFSWGSAHAAFSADNLSCNVFRPGGTGVLARCSGPSKAHGEITIELTGRTPNLVSEVKLTGAKGSFQQILKVSAEPTIDVETIGILHSDFDFDGREDFAIMEFLPAGPNVPYRYYLYDVGKAKFIPNGDLGKITSPEFRPADKEIVSYWRENAATGGTDIYIWKDGRPQLKERTVDRYTETGCVRAKFVQRGDKLAEVSRGNCE